MDRNHLNRACTSHFTYFKHKVYVCAIIVIVKIALNMVLQQNHLNQARNIFLILQFLFLQPSLLSNTLDTQSTAEILTEQPLPRLQQDGFNQTLD